ncbi:hypothetical protein MASSI9I_60061 [Massilia sp. 9I]|nr:hypothetical protein MASSI9I_60061 [Massilia sp. 9I]
MDPAAEALDLDAVVEHQEEDAQRDADGAVQVGGRDHAMMRIAQAEIAEGGGEHVDRQEVQRVHQGDPDEDGQRQRSNEAAVAVDDGFRLVFDHLDEHLDGSLEATRNARSGFACSHPHDQASDDAHGDRPEKGVVVDDGEVNRTMLVLVRQVAQVVLDVF